MRESSELIEGSGFFSLSPDLLCVLDSYGYFQHLNPSWQRVLGVAAVDLQSQPFWTWIHPEDRAIAQEHFQQVVQQPTTTTRFEVRFLSQAQTYKRLVWTLSIPGDRPFLYGVVQDVTEQREAEQALRESQRTLATLVSNLPGTVYRCRYDRLFSLEFISEGCFDLTGYTASELIQNSGTGLMQLTHPEDRERVWDQVKQALEQHRPFQLTYRLITATGQSKWVWEQGRGILDGNGELLALEGFMIDTTERMRAEQESRLLLTMTQAISASQDFLSALEVALAQICTATGWNYGEAWLPRPDQRCLERSSAWYGSTDRLAAFNQLSQELTFLPGEGLPGRVWQTQQPEWLENVAIESDSAFARTQMAIAFDLKAGLAIPIEANGQVLAVLVFLMFTAREEDQRLVDLVTAVATQLGSLMQLKQAEARYHSIFEHAVEGIFQTTPDGHYLSTNPALAQIYGYDSPEDLAVHLVDIGQQLYLEPQRRHDFAALMDQSGVVVDFESAIHRKDGTVIWICENARAVRDNQGRLLYYEGTVVDITKRKLAEAALRESEAENRALVNAIPDVIFRIHRDGTYLDFKAPVGFETLYPPEQYVGKRIQDLLPEQVASDRLFYIQQALATGQPQVCDHQFTVNGVLRDYEARFVVCAPDEVLGILRDITDRKQMERMKNEFVSVVSHELRTPLTSIRGSLGLIMGGVTGEIPEQARTMVDIAYKNSERLVLLINDILDIEKIESGKIHLEIKPWSLMSLLEQAIEANRAYGDQFGVTFLLEPSPSEIIVQVDNHRLMQVLANLLSNAAKFSPRDGTVLVSLVEHDSWYGSQRQRTVRVAVTDHGPGIPAEFRPRIFQKFAQADSSDTRQKGGTGLGLSISKAIIEKLGGQIGFESELGVGTTFYFELPIWNQPSAAIAPAEQSAEDGLSILICEDNPDIAMLLSLILKQGGFQTDIAYDAATAKQLLAQKPYAAMTVDLVLPGQDGISLIRELREQEATRLFPIIVVSANAPQDCQELNGGSFAVIDCLEKPIDQNRLIAAVHQAVQPQINRQPKIIHIEDDADIVQVVATILQDVAVVTPASSLYEAQQKLKQETFDLVILDLNLPDGFGLELLPRLTNQENQWVPVVVFSAQEVGLEVAEKVTAALVKSRTSNQDLLNTIKSLIQTTGVTSPESPPSLLP